LMEMPHVALLGPVTQKVKGALSQKQDH